MLAAAPAERSDGTHDLLSECRSSPAQCDICPMLHILSSEFCPLPPVMNLQKTRKNELQPFGAQDFTPKLLNPKILIFHFPLNY